MIREQIFTLNRQSVLYDACLDDKRNCPDSLTRLDLKPRQSNVRSHRLHLHRFPGRLLSDSIAHRHSRLVLGVQRDARVSATCSGETFLYDRTLLGTSAMNHLSGFEALEYSL